MNQDDSSVLSVHYRRSFGRCGLRSFQAVRHGESSLYLSFNYDRRHEIGFWRQPLGEGRFGDLVRRLHASGYDQIAEPTNPYPGAAPLQLGERRVGEAEPTFRILELARPELTEVTQLILELENEVRQCPVRVLRGRTRCLDTELREDGELNVEVVLENVGIESLEISHPMDAQQTKPALVLYYLDPSGIQHGFVYLPAKHVRHASPGVTGSTVTLPPGHSLSFAVRAHVPVEAGRYRPQLTFESTPPGGARAALEGQLDLDLGLVTVLERHAGSPAGSGAPPPLPRLGNDE